jgi:hypothetical protein
MTIEELKQNFEMLEDGEDKFIKMPEDRNELEFYSCWMS